MVTLLVAFGILLLAAVTQAATGFGFALVAIPLLTVATDPRTAVVGGGLAGIVVCVGVAVRERAHTQWRTAGVLVAAAIAGMPFGLLLLRTAPERLLTVLIAVSALGCTLMVWRQVRLVNPGWLAICGIGLAAGALSTSTGTNGPPLVAAFQAMRYDPRTFRATIAAVFAGTSVISIAGFLLTGLITWAASSVALVGLPAVALGWLAGDRLFARIATDRFRVFVLASLVVSSAVTLTRAAIM